MEWKEFGYYFFALAFHGIAVTIWSGVLREATDPNGNWEDGCYRGGYGIFKNANGTEWIDVIDNGDVEQTPPCNDEATTELIIILTSGGFVVLDTLVTVGYWLYLIATGQFSDQAGDYKLFATWQGDSEGGKIRKALRGASVLSAYLLAFTWACGFTASFNSRPGAFEKDRGDMMHPDNGAFEASGFLIAFMISILVTMLPREADGGYSSIY